MPLVYPGDPGSGDSETQNNNFNNLDTNFMCRGNTFLLNTSDPAYQYITQKRIQNTVRVPTSLYMWDLGALNVYQKPSLLLGLGVNWNQMSDRAVRHIQTNSGNSQGSFYHGSSTRHTQTRERPGAGTPGGAGVDIKHNSYYRYMSRLKAKKDIRRGPIPPTFGLPIPFLPQAPVYGGKTVKTSIVAGCNCPDTPITSNETLIYLRHFNPLTFDTTIVFNVGNYVYARTSLTGPVEKAQIINIVGNIYTVEFQDLTTADVTINEILPYFPCSCNNNNQSGYSETDDAILEDGQVIDGCYLLNKITGPHSLAYIQQLVNSRIN